MTEIEMCWFGAILSELAVFRQAQSGLHRFVPLPNILFLHIVFLFTFCRSNESLCLKAVILNSEKAPKPKNTPCCKEQRKRKSRFKNREKVLEVERNSGYSASWRGMKYNIFQKCIRQGEKVQVTIMFSGKRV